MRGMGIPRDALLLPALALAAIVIAGTMWNESAPGVEPVGTTTVETAYGSRSPENLEPAYEVEREAEAGPEIDDGVVAEAVVERPPVPMDETKEIMPAPEATSAPRVGIQAGHWRSADLPDELSRLRTSTGTAGGGVAEWQLNLDIAERVAELLKVEGIEVDVLPATVPSGYRADAFVALHADGDLSGRLSGFKLARATRSAIPEIDDALLSAIADKYAAATGLPVDTHISRNMTGYYAFAGRRLLHAVAPQTPAVIVELGFMTNASDRRVMLGAPDKVAQGVANGILDFLAEER